MYRCVRVLAVIAVCSICAFSANLTITPDTTLQAETANNTSAADSFAATTNGDAAAGNVSKLPIVSLLYPGATTQIFAHFQPWYGGPNHMNVGYSSNDPNQVHKQITDMISRGMAGMIVDWYGPNATLENGTTKLVMADLAARGGPFTFAVLEDSGALVACATTSGCNVTSQLISDLTYAYNTYEGPSSLCSQLQCYLRLNSRPAVFFFGEDQFPIDWNAVRNQVPGNPLFIFLDQSSSDNGFNHPQSDGAFPWISINPNSTTDIGLSALDGFYSTALTFPALYTFGGGYIGFNDSLAPWAPSPPLKMSQQCGQTWMQTLAETGKYYSSSNQLEFLQVVTWNDYEEGTEIESGIENCVTVSASVAGSTLNWAITGSESTLDHYTVFISTDGQNLMTQKPDVPAGTHSFDLSALGPGTYYLYVKAVGKPSFHNHISNAATFNPNHQPPVIVLSVNPTTGPAPLMVTASTAGSSDPNGTLTGSTIDFGDGSAAVSVVTAIHTYNANGTYMVTATVTDNVGLTATATQAVTVGTPSPVNAVLSVSPLSGVVPLMVTASTSGSSDSQAPIISSSINLGDGTIVNATTAAHTYTKSGLYIVTATLKDGNNNVGTATQTVTVSGVTVIAPTNGASVTSPVTFVAYAKSTAQITAMRIYVDNASVFLTLTNSINTSVPIANGTHNVVVQAWDGNGTVYKTPLTITVTSQTSDEPPTASLALSPTSGVAPLTVNASTAGSSDPDGAIVSSKIDFGDGTVVAGPTANHTYNNPGQYTVTATVTDSSGLSASTSGTVTVLSPGGCTLNSASPSVTICLPAANAVVATTVHIVAGTTDTRPIKYMQIYIDGKKQYEVSASSLDTSLSLPIGTHRLTVQANDGVATFKQTIYITVRSSPPPGSVTASPSSLTFSSQTVNTTSPAQTVTVNNGTSSSVTVSSVSTAGDFAQTNNCSSLATGANCTIQVTFTPTAAGVRSGTLSITTSAGNISVSLSGTGASAGSVTTSPTSLTFTSQTVNTTSPAQTVTVNNGTSSSVTVSSVSTTGDFAQQNNCSSLAAGASCVIQVTFTPTAAGTRSGTLSITTTAGNLSVSLSGTGASAGSVTASPTSLTFSSQTVNTTSPAQTVTVNNGTSSSVTVLSVSTAGDFAQTNNCSSLAAGANCTIQVTFTPTAAGMRSGTLSITTSAGNISVSLTGTGVSPQTCTLNLAIPSVTICDPAANAIVSAPVQVIAGTTDTKTVTLIQIYLDGKKVYEVKASSLNTSLAMSSGTHRLTVQAFDGTWFKQTINITVR